MTAKERQANSYSQYSFNSNSEYWVKELNSRFVFVEFNNQSTDTSSDGSKYTRITMFATPLGDFNKVASKFVDAVEELVGDTSYKISWGEKPNAYKCQEGFIVLTTKLTSI